MRQDDLSFIELARGLHYSLVEQEELRALDLQGVMDPIVLKPQRARDRIEIRTRAIPAPER